MKLKFPAGLSEFHHSTGQIFKPDADGNVDIAVSIHEQELSEFVKAGFTNAEPPLLYDKSTLTTVDIEGKQIIQQGANHGTD